MLWWRLHQYPSQLLITVERYARRHLRDGPRAEACDFNWWAHTLEMVNELASRYGMSPTALRRLPRSKFRSYVYKWQWRIEFDAKLQICHEQSRLQLLAAELEILRREPYFEHRTHWPGAQYLNQVNSKYHVRLLAMARIGTLPIETETGRWVTPPVPKEERLCTFGCGCVGNTDHFLHGCPHITAPPVESVMSSVFDRDWKKVAQSLERRWRSRKMILRGGTYKALASEIEAADFHEANQQT